MKKHDRPLKLATETVRSLGATQLAAAAGGVLTRPTPTALCTLYCN